MRRVPCWGLGMSERCPATSRHQRRTRQGGWVSNLTMSLASSGSVSSSSAYGWAASEGMMRTIRREHYAFATSISSFSGAAADAGRGVVGNADLAVEPDEEYWQVSITTTGGIMTTRNDYTRQAVEGFRANGGKVGGRWEGPPLLLLPPRGAKAAAGRTTPLRCLPNAHRLP